MKKVKLREYTTPLLIDYADEVTLVKNKKVESTNFYNAIFGREIASLRYRLFLLKNQNQPIAVIKSLIPVDQSSNQLVLRDIDENMELSVDHQYSAHNISQMVMLTWASQEEKKLLGKANTDLQVLIRSLKIKNEYNSIIRIEEDSMLPEYFTLEK
ncbi:hypothetical protein PT287_04495 [Lactobacillus sp. ESL0679]|uniref:hypothetical protein n=1 Tax=Lactobacillus sp. ESL0679 TaxID=2983209 RepID=UPI0023F8A1AB|nr:hypothetical protein [Lactobacillus sp. ESL0679]MDF7682786.1 hypothetical protein [Lactobacillus sp. ESL0679]